MTGGSELGPGSPGQPPGPHHIDPPQLLKLGLLTVREQQRRAMQNPRAMDQRVCTTSPADGGIHQSLSLLGLAGVIGNRKHTLALKRRSLETGRITETEAKAMTVRQQLLSHRPADAAAGTGNQNRPLHQAPSNSSSRSCSGS